MEIELIFGVIQAVVTAVLGSFTKKGKVPKRFIPLQNAIVGLVAGLLSVYFEVYDNVIIAMFMCLAVSMGVGGVYDATQTKRKK
jgi:hypothetical protein